MDRDSIRDAILLLNLPFSGEHAAPKPLTEGQYRKFALWLNRRNQTPGDLLTDDRNIILNDWDDHTELGYSRVKKPTREHIELLLERNPALDHAKEEWQCEGLWVLTRADEQYPARLRKRLLSKSPPVLFGCGEINLLNQASIAVVGSRHVAQEELDFSIKFGKHVTSEGAIVVSGGARGVDQAAMRGAMHADGAAVGVMAEGILPRRRSDEERQNIQDGQLSLVSQFSPETRWRGYQAMSRNKLIYCLSDAALVVASADGTKGKSGTWEGATENLKNRWVPLWVRKIKEPQSGNDALVKQGGHWLAEPFPSLNRLQNPKAKLNGSQKDSDQVPDDDNAGQSLKQYTSVQPLGEKTEGDSSIMAKSNDHPSGSSSDSPKSASPQHAENIAQRNADREPTSSEEAEPASDDASLSTPTHQPAECSADGETHQEPTENDILEDPETDYSLATPAEQTLLDFRDEHHTESSSELSPSDSPSEAHPKSANVATPRSAHAEFQLTRTTAQTVIGSSNARREDSSGRQIGLFTSQD